MLPDNVLRTAELPFVQSRSLPPPFTDRTVELWPLELARLGACLREVPPGARTCPLHAHVFEEEVFVVLLGTITVRELPDGADRYREYDLHPGDLVAYPANTRLAHGSWNRAETPAVMLALSDDQPGEICLYPDSGKMLLRGLGQIGVHADDADRGELAALEHTAAARERADRRGVDRLADADRPAHVVPAGSLPERDCGTLLGRQLSRAAGARAVFVNQDRLLPGGVTSPAHWHTADEEIVFVLEGHPTLRQLVDGVELRTRLQPGDAAHFAPGRRIAHQVLNETDEDAVLLVIGTDDPQDVTVFPERDRVHVRGLGATAPFQPLAYWDGEAENG